MFSARCAPVQFAGPKRVIPPAFDATHPRLPRIDAVVLSHNHYDHLDTGSVRALHARFGNALRWWVVLFFGGGWMGGLVWVVERSVHGV